MNSGWKTRLIHVRPVRPPARGREDGCPQPQVDP